MVATEVRLYGCGYTPLVAYLRHYAVARLKSLFGQVRISASWGSIKVGVPRWIASIERAGG